MAFFAKFTGGVSVDSLKGFVAKGTSDIIVPSVMLVCQKCWCLKEPHSKEN